MPPMNFQLQITKRFGSVFVAFSVLIFAIWSNASVWIIALLVGFHLLTTGVALLTLVKTE